MVDGRKVEEILIKEGTPGILIFQPKENRFAVSFDASGDDSFLMFGPNPKVGNRYVMLASDWNRKTGKVTYEGKQYGKIITPHLYFIHILLHCASSTKLYYAKSYLVGPPSINICSTGHQGIHHLSVSLVASPYQRRPLSHIQCVYFGSRVNEHLHQADMAFPSNEVEAAAFVIILSIQVSIVREEG